MAIKLICGSFLVVVLLGCLADAKSIYPPSRTPQTNNPNPQNPYSPSIPEQTSTHDEGFHSCAVDRPDRISCFAGSGSVTKDYCDSLNCCYDNGACFFGVGATLHCKRDGKIIFVVARDATVPRIDVNTISLLGDDGNCKPEISSKFLVYEFTPSECGTVVKDEQGVVSYNNKLSSEFEYSNGEHGVITRDVAFQCDFTCQYNGVITQALILNHHTFPSPVSFASYGNMHLELRLGNGECVAKGCVEDDVAFTSYYSVSEYPVQKVLQEDVYVEVRLLDQSDPNLHLKLQNCWVTDTTDPYSGHRWDLIHDGCPSTEDPEPTRYLDVDLPPEQFPTHYKRFAFKMFTFVNRALSSPGKKTPQDIEVVEPTRDQLYIHCSCTLCIPSPGNSCQSCYNRRKRDTAKVVYREETVVVTGASVRISDSA